MKTGFIGIIGRPNVGKSTLMNAILGEKVAITADKPQTTRNTIRGIYTRFDDEYGDEGVQMVFIDTPGIHKPHSKLGNFMTESAINTFKEVDVILFLVDITEKLGKGDMFVIDALKNVNVPVILVINKIDKMEPEAFRKIYETYDEMGVFEGVYGTSALEGKNVDDLVAGIEEHLEEGPMFFPEDMVTDHPERFIVSEIIREKVLHYLEDEVPHGVAIEIESYKEEPNITRIGAVIYCERKSHKGIIIGKGGKMIKDIGTKARKDIVMFLGMKVYLELWVRVEEKWRDRPGELKKLGYFSDND